MTTNLSNVYMCVPVHQFYICLYVECGQRRILDWGCKFLNVINNNNKNVP